MEQNKNAPHAADDTHEREELDKQAKKEELKTKWKNEQKRQEEDRQKAEEDKKAKKEEIKEKWKAENKP
jgi:hypothetical protein